MFYCCSTGKYVFLCSLFQAIRVKNSQGRFKLFRLMWTCLTESSRDLTCFWDCRGPSLSNFWAWRLSVPLGYFSYLFLSFLYCSWAYRCVYSEFFIPYHFIFYLVFYYSHNGENFPKINPSCNSFVKTFLYFFFSDRIFVLIICC